MEYFNKQMNVYLSGIIEIIIPLVKPHVTPHENASLKSGTTTVLSLTKMGIGGRASMPQVSYLTSLDYFNFLCFAYVFGAIVEFAMINFFERMAKRRRIQVEDAKKAFDERTEAEIAIMEFNMVGPPLRIYFSFPFSVVRVLMVCRFLSYGQV